MKQILHKTKHLATLLTLATLLALPGVGWGQIASWSLTADGVPSGVNANITAGNFTSTGVGTLNFGASGAYADTWSTGAINTGKYFEISVSPNTGYNINITAVNFGERRSNTGIRDYQVRWSLDNFSNSTTIATVNVPDDANERIGNITGLNINVSAGQTLKIRWFGYNAEATGGTWRINDGTLNLTGTVNAAGNTVPILSTPTSASITNNSGALGATISSDGGAEVTESGVVYGTSATPTGNATATSPTATAGAFTVDVSSLTPQTLYYYRGYAVNTEGIGYSSDGTFRTWSNAPSGQATNLAGTLTSTTSANLTWTAATFPGSGATTTGYVLLRATSPNTPSLSNGNGAAPAAGANTTIVSSSISGAATSQASTSLSTNTTYNYLLIPYCWDGTNAATYNYLTASAPTAVVSTPSALSDVVAVASSEIATISSLINDNAPLTSSTGIQVWQITVRDGGATMNDEDILPTIVTGFTLTQNSGNAVNNWLDAIKTIALFDGSTWIANASSINETTIVFSGLTVSVADNSSKTLSLRLSLNSTLNNLGSGNLDGDDFVFNITNANFTTLTNETSSTKASFTTASSTNGQNALDVVATKLLFVQQPTTVAANASINPSPSVQATDIGGNRDLQFASTIEMTATGSSLSGSPVSVGASSGLATFSSLQLTTPATGVTLSAASTGLAGVNSNSFDVLYAEPTNQGTSLTFSGITPTSMNLSWTAAIGGADGYIVVLRSGASYATTNPVDATTYSIGNVLGNGTVVYVGSNTTVSVTSLTANTQYSYNIYSFNGSSSLINYKNLTPLQGQQYTYANEPTTVGAVSFTNVTATTFTINATSGDGSGRIYVLKQGSVVDFVPVDGTVYTANTNFSAGTGLGTNSDNKVVAVSGTSVNVTGLTANSVYYVAVYEFNGSAASINYLTTTTGTGNRSTLAAVPSAPTELTFSSVAVNSLNASFTAPGTAPTGYLVLRRTGSAVTGAPVAGTEYIVGQTIGTGEVIYIGTSAWDGYAQTGLVDNTRYYYAVYSYNGAGELSNYSTALTGNQLTLSVSAPNALAATATGATGFTANWNAADGASSGYLLDVSSSGTFTEPGAATLNEGFESGMPGSYSTGSYTLSSGSWSFVNVVKSTNTAYNHNGTAGGCQLQGNTSASAISPSLNSVGTVTFWGIRGSTATSVAVQKIVSGVTTTVQTVPLTQTMTQYSVVVDDNNSAVQIKFLNGAGVAYLDDVSIGYIGDLPSFIAGYNAKPISGQATVSSNVNGLTANTNYYYRVRAVGGNSTSANSDVIPVTTTDYASTITVTENTNWSSFISVNDGTDVTVDNGAELIVDVLAAECNNLNINAGGKLTVNSGKGIAIGGNLHIKSPTSMGPAGSFIDRGTTVVGGNYIVERYISQYTGNNDGWHFMASPFNEAVGINSTAFDPGATDDLYAWDETQATDNWRNHKAGYPLNFDAGNGYLVAYESSTIHNFTLDGASYSHLNDDITLLDNAAITSGTYDDGGWYLLGNSFLSAVTWDPTESDWLLDGIEIAAQVLNDDAGNYIAVDEGEVIPSMQGFFVKVTSNGSNGLLLPESLRTHSSANYLKDEIADNISLKVSSDLNSYYDVTKVRFREGATESYDASFDASKMFGWSDAPQLYTVATSGKGLSINSIPVSSESVTVPLSFVAKVSGNYQISIDKNTLQRGVILKDKLLNSSVDISQTGVYSFSANPDQTAERFELLFLASTGIDNPTTGEAVQVYAHSGLVYLNGAPAGAKVRLTDITGRMVQRVQLGNSGLNTVNVSNLPHGVYVVTVNDGKHLVSHKIIL